MHLITLSSKRFQLISCLALAAFLFSALPARAGLTLEALRRDGYGVVNIRQPRARPNDLIVEGTVNGRKVSLDLDTGFGDAGVSLDVSFTGTLGLQTTEMKERGVTATGKEIVVRQATANTVTLGNVVIKGVPVRFGVFKGIRGDDQRREVGADGFLGSGFLRTCSAIIDLHNLKLYLRPPGTGRRAMLGPALTAAGLAEASFAQSGTSNCFVNVEINGVPAKMIIDTGATLSTVDNQFASQMKARAYRSNLAFVDAAGVTDLADRVSLGSFKIDGIKANVPDLLLSQVNTYRTSGGKVVGLLGMDILGQNWSIIDFGQQKLYFAPSR